MINTAEIHGAPIAINFGVVRDSGTPKIHQEHVHKRKTRNLFIDLLLILGTA